jgi:hypothetical protein
MLRVGVLEGLVCENGNGMPWVGLVGPFPKLTQIRFFSIFRGFGAHTGRAVAVDVAGAAG